ncbi:hypothetical protein Dimus_024205 [Dionaea muscipula]
MLKKQRKMSGCESSMSMKCLSCKKNLYYKTSNAFSATSNASIAGPCWTTKNGHHTTNGPGNCKECYVKLKRENEELRANVDFLRHSSPLSGDVTLVAYDDSPDAPIPANKFILASRSPVFKAMFETAMEESISGVIKISDVTYNILHAFVNYLYTANVCLDEKIASDLLIFAEKYQVKHLKEHCERYLVSTLNWNNSISNYAFAHKYNARKLLQASLSIITNDMDKFMGKDYYGELVKKDSSFVLQILEAYTRKQMRLKRQKNK